MALETGIKGTGSLTVSEAVTAKTMGSGTLDVLATPAMIALIEETAWKSVADHLDEGQATVGTKLSVEHIAPTPLGMKVECRTELVEIDRRRLVFSVEVSDEKEAIGKGIHERFIISAGKFQQKADAKNNPPGQAD